MGFDSRHRLESLFIFYVCKIRRKQGFENSRSPSKTVATRRVTRSKVCTDDLQVLGATIQNLYALDLSTIGYAAYSLIHLLFDIHIAT